MQFPFWSLIFIFITFTLYPKKRVSFLLLPLYQKQKMHTWQMECTVDTLKADLTIKIIIKKCYLVLKNATSASKFKKFIY